MGKTLLTKWGKKIDPEHVLEDYPRPGMKRDSYICLNGFWDYAITKTAGFPEQYDGRILVPFSPEAVLSGVNRMLAPGMFLPSVDCAAKPGPMRRLVGIRGLFLV